MDFISSSTRNILVISSLAGLSIIVVIFGIRQLAHIRRRITTPTACLDEIPAIVNSLQRHSREGTFVMFILPLPGNSKDDFVAVQLSFEDGMVGFDWLLDSGMGNEERVSFETLAKEKGWSLEEKEGGGFQYLRVQGRSPTEIAEIGIEIITSLYEVDRSEQLEVNTNASNWRIESYAPPIA